MFRRISSAFPRPRASSTRALALVVVCVAAGASAASSSACAGEPLPASHSSNDPANPRGPEAPMNPPEGQSSAPDGAMPLDLKKP